MNGAEDRESTLMAALEAAGFSGVWQAMPPSHRKRWLDHVLEAAKPETAARRIDKVVMAMRKRAGEKG